MAAKYTSQWTQRAKINPVPQDLADGIVEEIKSGKIGLEQITERKAGSQFTILVSMWGAALEAGMDTADSLAEDILYKQATNIRRYRKNAYPMSERQVQVVWNKLSTWMRVDAKTW